MKKFLIIAAFAAAISPACIAITANNVWCFVFALVYAAALYFAPYYSKRAKRWWLIYCKTIKSLEMGVR